MGPKGKMSDEKKMEMYDAWKASGEYASIERFIAKRGEIDRLELSVTDVSYDLQPYLDAMFALVAELKVPGRKAKGKFYIDALLLL